MPYLILLILMLFNLVLRLFLFKQVIYWPLPDHPFGKVDKCNFFLLGWLLLRLLSCSVHFLVSLILPKSDIIPISAICMLIISYSLIFLVTPNVYLTLHMYMYIYMVALYVQYIG